MQIHKQIDEWYSKWFSGEEELSDEEEEALEELKTIATKSAERLEEEIMMLFVDVDAGGQVTEKETITINDVRKLFETLSKTKE